MGYGSKDLVDRMHEAREIRERAGFTEKPSVGDLVALLQTELSELYEAYRKDRLHAPSDHAEQMKAKGCPVMTCAEEEIADIIIRALHTADVLGVNPEHAVRDKLMYNATREFRHGGKRV